MNKILFLLLGFSLFPLFSFGQLDTIVAIPEIEVSAEKIRKQPVGTQIKKWNTEKLNSLPAQNLGELLRKWDFYQNLWFRKFSYFFDSRRKRRTHFGFVEWFFIAKSGSWFARFITFTFE
jgi:hypothetical protein